LLRAWLESVGLDGLSETDLVAYMQDERFTHADLYRRARRAHERRLRGAVQRAFAAAGRGELGTIGPILFDACLPVIPYAPAAAFVARERAKIATREGELPRIALVADGIGAMHGVTRTIEEIRERGVDGFEIEVIGTDPNVDRRLASVVEIEIPHYAGIELGIPSLPAAVEAITAGRYDVIHVCAPGPSAIAAALVARAMEIPLVGSYHTELAAYAGLRSGEQTLELAAQLALAAFYGQCRIVLSPSRAADRALEALGIAASRIARWDRGVDTDRFTPARRDEQLLGGAINVLYAGRVAAEKNIDLLAEAFEQAHAQDPRLHLVIAGDGPEAGRLRERLGPRASWLGWLEGEALAATFASADVLCFASATDTFGQVVLEAQASGLAVLAADAGGPRDLITSEVDGLLREPTPAAFADALLALAARRCCGHDLARPACAVPRSGPGVGPSTGSARDTRRRWKTRALFAMRRSGAATIAVALHDVEPATFERCALIRDWLDDHGVDRVTLLVIPARDLHPLSDRRPEIATWLAERVRGGDAVAQHGFQHFRARPQRWSLPLRPRLHSEAAEFARPRRR
jgi:glycosyltransferase involved in cell wall biosynthesis